MNQPSVHANNGFTLIELLIVIAMSVVLMLTASTLFLTFLVGNTKLNSEKLIKQEGRYAIQQMEFLLRNAIELIPNYSGQECEASMSSIRFNSIDGELTTFMVEEDGGVDKIASNSGVYLTSNAVTIVDGLHFECIQEDDQSHPHININFTLRRGTPGLDEERDIIEETFSTSTTLRSL